MRLCRQLDVLALLGKLLRLHQTILQHSSTDHQVQCLHLMCTYSRSIQLACRTIAWESHMRPWNIT